MKNHIVFLQSSKIQVEKIVKKKKLQTKLFFSFLSLGSPSSFLISPRLVSLSPKKKKQPFSSFVTKPHKSQPPPVFPSSFFFLGTFLFFNIKRKADTLLFSLSPRLANQPLFHCLCWLFIAKVWRSLHTTVIRC